MSAARVSGELPVGTRSMSECIAPIRGINVGRNNRIAMTDLKLQAAAREAT
ncbi:MAG: DUF1697 domain-containing protein [Steroidobacteraceae bacterium]